MTSLKPATLRSQVNVADPFTPVRCQETPRFPQLGDTNESWITGRIYLNMETLKEWEEKKENPDQTRDKEMVL